MTFEGIPVDFSDLVQIMITEFAKKLIEIPSLTPDDGGCMRQICGKLEPAGFTATHLKFGDVDNLWLTHGDTGPVLCFLGHTDVVPPGPEADWVTNPFKPEVRDGILYGRGAADMKGSLAAMVYAFDQYISFNPEHEGTLAMLLTSDEEGIAVNGTARVIEYLVEQGVSIDWCLVGEPSSQDKVGDIIKIGRRGSLTGHLVVYGVQGHVAYPQLAENPVHLAIPVLNELCQTEWDKGNEHYDPTSFQISNISAGSGTDNVIPGTVTVQFNFRYSTESREDDLKQAVEDRLQKHGLRFGIEWLPSSKPFLTGGGRLLEAVTDAVKATNREPPVYSTAGGTSDGRFIAPTGAEVIELGPVNRTIHRVNECVSVKDLETLSEMYLRIIGKLLGEKSL